MPKTDDEAIESIRKNYIGYDVPYTFATEGLSYTEDMGRVRIYKRGQIRSLTNTEVRDLVDILLMAIHWQGFRIDDEAVMKSICEQHEDSPRWSNYWKEKNPAGRAHRRIMNLFESDKCKEYLQSLQERAARDEVASVA